MLVIAAHMHAMRGCRGCCGDGFGVGDSLRLVLLGLVGGWQGDGDKVAQDVSDIIP